MTLSDFDIDRILSFLGRIVPQSFAYRDLTGQLPASGTWTPVLTFSTPGDLSVSYSLQIGYWMKIGRRVFIDFGITTSAFTHTTAVGAVLITGLPFTSANVSNIRWTGALSWQGITKANYTYVSAHVTSAEAQIRIQTSGSAQNTSNISSADMPTGGTVSLRGSLNYETDS